MTARNPYSGPAVLSAGFRPFFLLATMFGALAIALWLAMREGALSLSSVLSPVDWHVHEMIFGYGAAVVAGFLFTAVPNWTGRLPTRGAPLAVLSLVWIAGRLACAGFLGVGPWGVLMVDQLFLLLVGAMIAREIIAGRNWRNLKVLLPVTAFWGANVAFHVEVLQTGFAATTQRLGIAILIFLIMLIGGRIIPSFTRNWLVKRSRDRLPAPFDRFDGFAIATGVAALLFWVAQVSGPTSALLFALAAGLQAARLWRWRGLQTWRSPLLLMLHLSYAFIPAGFAVAALAALGHTNAAASAHLLGAGAVGTMTLAVMIRATLGHTGRGLEAGPVGVAAFLALMLAAVSRLLAEAAPALYEPFVVIAGMAWIIGFLLAFGRIAIPVCRPRKAPGVPSRAP
ncbi:NnrS family protein [Maritimibacter sp. UBA3975]|uniref:NnrS family protein n=1 Tax=Maritimibacter sp. UBA3975 TaxID=1946833 RepID=UPI000C0B2559|nr:NnrS family protein [Maritimibacter sp. UBA3975]MAM59922.1 short-chain dehydrogenase [Maritimibacter sp.]|tara:strand:- start:20758 stop:21951 length:1194 start_codon:yes stop_codon:yes gene_type:complete